MSSCSVTVMRRLRGRVDIPLGVLLLPHLDMIWFKAILGSLLVLWCPVMLLSKHLPMISVGGRLADGIVGMAGGVLGGIGGVTGTIPTLWCTLRGYPKDTQRIVIQNFNLSMLMVTMGTYLATGIVTRDMLPLFAIVAPAMLVPTLLALGCTSASARHGFVRSCWACLRSRAWRCWCLPCRSC